MGTYCCKTENEEEQKLSECVNVYEAKTCTIDSYNDILKPRPPCMYGHKCPCPCHAGGECVFFLEKISFTLILKLFRYFHVKQLRNILYVCTNHGLDK